VLLKVKVRKAASFCPWPGIRSYHWGLPRRADRAEVDSALPYLTKSSRPNASVVQVWSRRSGLFARRNGR